MGQEANIAFFFVDEAGDMTLFDKRRNAYGEYYSDSNPLALRKTKAF